MLRLSKVIMFIHRSSNSHLATNLSKMCLCVQNNCLQHCIGFDVKYSSYLEPDEKPKKKKTLRVPKVMLIRPDDSITFVYLEEAYKIAKKHNFELVETANKNVKSRLSVYKLLRLSDVVDDINNNEDIKQCARNNIANKHTKLFTVKSKISNHDLKTKIDNMNKLLKKGCNVKISVAHPEGGQENVLKHIATNIEGTLLKENVQKSSTVITYSPLLQNSDNNLK